MKTIHKKTSIEAAIKSKAAAGSKRKPSEEEEEDDVFEDLHATLHDLTDEERKDFFEECGDDYCFSCGQIYGRKETPDNHDCPALDEDEEEGDDGEEEEDEDGDDDGEEDDGENDGDEVEGDE